MKTNLNKRVANRERAKRRLNHRRQLLSLEFRADLVSSIVSLGYGRSPNYAVLRQIQRHWPDRMAHPVEITIKEILDSMMDESLYIVRVLTHQLESRAI